MSLIDLAKPKAKKVLGIDASTKSLAFAIIKDGKLTHRGEIDLNGDSFYDRLIDCRWKSDAILRGLDVDYVAIEKAIMARSADAALKLGMVVGVVISSLATTSFKVEEVAPISWQSYIGNPNIVGAKKKVIAGQFPDKSATWINNHIRNMRKEKTKQWVKEKYGVDVDSDNVSDAIGIATYVAEQRVS